MSDEERLERSDDHVGESWTYYNFGKPERYDDNPKSSPDKKINRFYDNLWNVVDANTNLLIDKHHCYGPKNIAEAPGGALNGLRVRMHDKLARLNHIIDNPDVDDLGESLEDTLADLANYAVIGQLVLRKQWPQN